MDMGDPTGKSYGITDLSVQWVAQPYKSRDRRIWPQHHRERRGGAVKCQDLLLLVGFHRLESERAMGARERESKGAREQESKKSREQESERPRGRDRHMGSREGEGGGKDQQRNQQKHRGKQ